jgi:hypothetical protein
LFFFVCAPSISMKYKFIEYEEKVLRNKIKKWMIVLYVGTFSKTFSSFHSHPIFQHEQSFVSEKLFQVSNCHCSGTRLWMKKQKLWHNNNNREKYIYYITPWRLENISSHFFLFYLFFIVFFFLTEMQWHNDSLVKIKCWWQYKIKKLSALKFHFYFIFIKYIFFFWEMKKLLLCQ